MMHNQEEITSLGSETIITQAVIKVPLHAAPAAGAAPAAAAGAAPAAPPAAAAPKSPAGSSQQDARSQLRQLM